MKVIIQTSELNQNHRIYSDFALKSIKEQLKEKEFKMLKDVKLENGVLSADFAISNLDTFFKTSVSVNSYNKEEGK